MCPVHNRTDGSSPVITNIFVIRTTGSTGSPVTVRTLDKGPTTTVEGSSLNPGGRPHP